jgi:hypothetical protein
VIKGVDEILNPAWSPDGRTIAFTGMRQGLTDLYVYDLRAARLTQLTSDPYADVHPAWSPDSRRIAFASDRFSSDLASLHMGPLQLAFVDAETGAVEPVPAFDRGKHINPQWSPDGQALLFIADPEGLPNVYRLTFSGREIDQMSNVGTGISGITASSPALSVSSGTGRVAVSVYDAEQYHIYVRDVAKPACPLKRLPTTAAALAPTDRDGGVVTTLLAQPSQGLPLPQQYPTSPYKPKLSLAGVGQPTAGVGISRFGATVGGGAAVLFSDMLGDRLLATAVQVDSGMTGHFGVNDIAAEAAYFNLERRWNWSVSGGQIPYVSGVFERGLGTSPGGEPIGVDREVIYRQTQRSAASTVAYPLDRARRFEFQGGISRTSFEEIVTSITYSPVTGDILSETSQTLDLAPRINLATSGVAYVVDTANFGPTSPIQGQRYRLEVAPTFGTINFTGVLVDYRRYVMPVSFFTLAGRLLHYGRYGSGGDDTRLYPIYVNDPGFVRGYDTFYYYSTECGLAPGDPCRLTDRFAGSRILVGNVELRFPLLRPFRESAGMYGPLPIEVAVFADSGVAWNGFERPELLGGTRPGISSAGIAVRMSMGFAVAEFDFTHPFQRPEEGWVFGFNLMPGW